MHRFVKVMGKPGLLVAPPYDPRARSDTPRFLGMRLKPVKPDEAPKADANLADFYEPAEQVVRLDSDARSHVETAIAKGELVCLGRCVASTHEEAAEAMKPAKGGKRGE